jgi:RNA polymerase sigma-70 factor (ECF subfamily)
VPLDAPAPPATLTTSTTLLAGLADANNHGVWTAFVSRYRPILIRLALRAGWPAQDAEDLAQQTLGEFVKSYRNHRFDRDRGRLRDWLFGIARNQMRNAARRRSDAHGQAGPADLEDAAARRLFDQEWERAVLARCLEEIRGQVGASTYQAFELFALRRVPANSVAAEMGITENAVFLAKRRVLSRLRELLPVVAETW